MSRRRFEGWAEERAVSGLACDASAIAPILGSGADWVVGAALLVLDRLGSAEPEPSSEPSAFSDGLDDRPDDCPFVLAFAEVGSSLSVRSAGRYFRSTRKRQLRFPFGRQLGGRDIDCTRAQTRRPPDGTVAGNPVAKNRGRNPERPLHKRSRALGAHLADQLDVRVHAACLEA
jgi:hypothetical protein